MSTNPPSDLEQRQGRFKQATDFAVSRLGQFENRDVLLDQMREKFGITIPEAESLLAYIEQNEEARVKARQLPIVSALAAGLIIAGLTLGLLSLTTRLSLTMLLVGLGMVIGGIVGLWDELSSLIRSLFGSDN
jgi:hypothetical protein